MSSDLESATNGERPISSAAEAVRANLAGVRSVFALASARGGPGKSTLAVNLAAALALKGRKVGLLDADVESPSIAAMLGLGRTRVFAVAGRIEPASGPMGLRVIGADMVEAHEPAPLSLTDAGMAGGNEPEPLASAEAEPAASPTHFTSATAEEPPTPARLLGETQFGALDCLVVDLAAGPAALRDFIHLLPAAAVVVVSTPTESAVLATRRMMETLRRDAIAPAGLILNMTSFHCESCHSARPLWPQGDAPALSRNFDLPILARLPFDARLAECADRGELFVRGFGDSPTAKQLTELAAVAEAAARRSAAAANPPAQEVTS